MENLKEKLLLIPKDSAETIQVVKERLGRPQANTGSIARSRSWQGFSAAHRTSRQQAFWDAQRYEIPIIDRSRDAGPKYMKIVVLLLSLGH